MPVRMIGCASCDAAGRLPATGGRRALARLDGTLRVDERELPSGECNTGAAA